MAVPGCGSSETPIRREPQLWYGLDCASWYSFPLPPYASATRCPVLTLGLCCYQARCGVCVSPTTASGADYSVLLWEIDTGALVGTYARATQLWGYKRTCYDCENVYLLRVPYGMSRTDLVRMPLPGCISSYGRDQHRAIRSSHSWYAPRMCYAMSGVELALSTSVGGKEGEFYDEMCNYFYLVCPVLPMALRIRFEMPGTDVGCGAVYWLGSARY
eukprot:2701252-Rhodomonas_salina.3